ncbi:SH3 domain-containing protein [Qiania dongpingensis]|uniref:SH3 domain-containing protein n=1 Tax=Qiania dongpingensis TaxID=2763669 RepID=A0A7G9G0G6_9FIRM|nr:SH3 domain-containing protein [Qiania dongpingensis]QNM04298.1 SH3 domain-containing protein [Qiania dongpingensis]
MLTKKKSIVSCFVIGALLCTLTSPGDRGSTAAKEALTVAAAEVSQDSGNGKQDIRNTSKEEHTREIVKTAIKSTEKGSSDTAPETAVVRIAGVSVKSGAADYETAVQSEQTVKAFGQSAVQPQENPADGAQSAAGNTQAAAQTGDAVSAIAPELENKVVTTVDTYLNIRQEPSEESEIIGRLYEGSAGDMLENNGEWTRISSGGVEGWVHNEFVVSGEAAQSFAQEALEQLATVTEEGVRVRAGASVDSTWIGVVNANETYQVVPEEVNTAEENTDTENAGAAEQPETAETAGQPEETQSQNAADADNENAASQQEAPELKWVKILYGDGEEGYVCADYVTTAFNLGQAKSMEEIKAEEEAKAAAEAKAAEEAKAAAEAEAAKEAKAAEKTAPKKEEAAAPAQSDSGWVAMGEFKITAYCGGACCNGKWAGTTASGASPSEGRTIAVAPWIIPYGTQVRIEGLDGVYVAEDTGGFANSNPYQIDLFVSEHSHAGSWGVRYRQVWVKR